VAIKRFMPRVMQMSALWRLRLHVASLSEGCQRYYLCTVFADWNTFVAEGHTGKKAWHRVKM